MRVPLAALNLLGGLDNGVGGSSVEQSEIRIGFGGGLLDHGDGADESRVGAEAADGEVLDGASRLDAVIGVGRNFFESEGVFFGAGGEGGGLQQRDDSGRRKASDELLLPSRCAGQVGQPTNKRCPRNPEFPLSAAALFELLAAAAGTRFIAADLRLRAVDRRENVGLR